MRGKSLQEWRLTMPNSSVCCPEEKPSAQLPGQPITEARHRDWLPALTAYPPGTPPPELNFRKPMWRPRSAVAVGSACLASWPAVPRGGGTRRRSFHRPLCTQAHARHGIPQGTRGEQTTGRAGRPARAPIPRQELLAPPAVCLGSWEKVSNFGISGEGFGKIADHLD